MFLDVAIYSKAANGGDVHVQFVDWIPLICNILGMLVYVSLVVPSQLLSSFVLCPPFPRSLFACCGFCVFSTMLVMNVGVVESFGANFE